MPNRIIISKTGSPEVLKYESYNLNNKIEDNNVRIKHHSIGVNYIDTYHRSGLYALPHKPPICPETCIPRKYRKCKEWINGR